MAAQLELRTETVGEAAHLILEGELDLSSAQRVEREIAQLEATAPATIVLDLRGLTFMDSTGLRIVVAADARGREADRRLVIVRGPAAIQRIFTLTRLDERLNLVDDPSAINQPSRRA
jgi:anti-sigma B factor antagonist